MNKSACRSCGAEIIWAITPAGRRMPVDAAPDPTGTLRLAQEPYNVTVVVAGPSDEEPRHRPHFATCPQANEWRR